MPVRFCATAGRKTGNMPRKSVASTGQSCDGCVMTETDIEALATRIRQTLGCGKELADDYAQGIGDPPEIIHGRVLVRNSEGRIIARVPESVLLP